MGTCTLNHSGAILGGQHTPQINALVSLHLDRMVLLLKLSPVSKVDFEEEPDMKPSVLPESSPSSPSFHQSRLNRFINDLSRRPNDPPHDLNDSGWRNSSHGVSSSISSSFISNLASSSQNPQSLLNPESDSFAYLETVLESLAVLGRLGNALDNVAQRLPGEIYTLVETTLDEVTERMEYGRRGSMYSINATVGKSDGIYIRVSDDHSTTMGPVVSSSGGFLSASHLRLAALESSAKQVDHEIMKDFFWTLYSKMDAVAQGLRVIYEVTNRIASVSFRSCPSLWGGLSDSSSIASRLQGLVRYKAWIIVPPR